MIELLLSLMMRAQMKFKSFCDRALTRHVAASDPLPHAEESHKALVEQYVRTGSEDVLREIHFRVAVGLVSESEIARMTQRALDGSKE